MARYLVKAQGQLYT